MDLVWVGSNCQKNDSVLISLRATLFHSPHRFWFYSPLFSPTCNICFRHWNDILPFTCFAKLQTQDRPQTVTINVLHFCKNKNKSLCPNVCIFKYKKRNIQLCIKYGRLLCPLLDICCWWHIPETAEILNYTF